uniref:Putative cullin n=1 Tax=Trypanosoma congolense (strain IL3000) TaxID=1068625 RepID=G0UWV5_TRYCI|nr:putative cullin [Trypanosoma congolense IL3000]
MSGSGVSLLGDSTGGKWAIISDAVRAIFNNNESHYSFQVVHHSVFQMCQSQHSATLLQLLSDTISERVINIREQLLTSSWTTFLQDLAKQWTNFSLAIKEISGALLYLGNSYSANNQAIVQMGEEWFYKLVLTNEDISAALVGCVRRSLEPGVDSDMMPELTGKLHELYKDTIFVPFVEQPLLKVLIDRYKGNMEKNLDEMSVDDYISWVQGVTKEAQCDVLKLVSDKMDRAIEQCMEEILIKQNTQKLLLSCLGNSTTMADIINNMSVRYLACALNRVGETDAFLDALVTTAKTVVFDLLDEAAAGEPVDSLEKILTLKNHLESLIKGLVGVPQGRKSPITCALAEFLSGHPDFSKSLAYYYDAKVRSRDAQDLLDQAVTNTLSLYQLLKSKDSFEHTAKLLLAERLISCTSEDALARETVLVERLRCESEDHIANHLDIMIKDIRERDRINREFTDLTPPSELPLNFDVTVITAGVWPSYPDLEMRLPESMMQCAALFRSYYTSHHNGRVLSFHTCCGTVSFLLSHGKEYELIAPTSFVNTILCFQNNPSSNGLLTLQEVCEKTNLIENTALLQLGSLTRISLVTTCYVDGCLQYEFNRNFEYCKNKLRIRATAGGKVSRDSTEVLAQQASLDTSHTERIQATLIQIMKSKKVMCHAEVFREVGEALGRSGITPTVAHIKYNLEALMNKGLILRGPRPDMYVYEA